MRADQVTAHFQNDRGHGEHEADPEPARHIREFGIGRRIEARDLRLQRHAADRAGEFGIGRRIEARDLRLQRHAADRAGAGTDLADLRMHRAGVDRALRYGGFGFCQVRAEMVAMTVARVIVASATAPHPCRFLRWNDSRLGRTAAAF